MKKQERAGGPLSRSGPASASSPLVLSALRAQPVLSPLWAGCSESLAAQETKRPRITTLTTFGGIPWEGGQGPA